ncbi:hypothetical protein [Streptomyces synnematoformans]|uniref:TrbL/VirB6 plasmid conjugal transfer protein n=1 Tax=Streptomyces synnematoformans TaxID=415721 RepID=A0ABP5J4Z4_9ACTN
MGWCGFWDKLPGPNAPGCKAVEEGADAVGDAVAGAWERIVQDLAEAASAVVREIATGWLAIDSPTLDQESGPVGFIHGSTIALTSYVAVACLIIASVRLAWERRAEPARQALAGVLRLVAASAAGVAVINLLTAAGDDFSRWIVNRSTGCGGYAANEECVDAFGERLLLVTAFAAVDRPLTGLIFVMALLLIVASIVQIAFMLARNALLIVLAGTLPLTAAASTTEAGRAWFNKSVGWLLAFVLYKPTAAIIYAAGFASIGKSESGEFMTQVSGLMLLLLAALTLPALMRIAVPVVSAVGGWSAAGAIQGTGRAVAQGAMAIKTGGGSAAARPPAGAARTGGRPGAGGASGTAGGRPGGRPGGGGPGGGRPDAGGGTRTGGTGTGNGQGPAGGRSRPVPAQPQSGAPAGGGPRGAEGQPSGAPSRGTTDTGGPPSGGRRRSDEGGPHGSR